ncbi:MAG: glutamate formimidoyltransferase [Vulcanimicrobiaceae bacterium]
MSDLFETVPNISEGRREDVVRACTAALAAFGARVLHVTSDSVHNRSVITAVGTYAQLCDGAVALAGAASRAIDLRVHSGVHPRIGALDVLPFVPFRDATMADAVRLAHETAARIWTEHHVPSFLYAEAAASSGRRNLSSVRAGQFEGLAARFERPEWTPDYGDARAHTTAGAIAIGARKLLIAFNVELQTGNLAVARDIARALRESGGGLRTLRAMGLRLNAEVVQVSLNVTDFAATPLYRVVELVRRLAKEHDVTLLRSELIGCIPAAAVRDSAAYYLGVSSIERTIN